MNFLMGTFTGAETAALCFVDVSPEAGFDITNKVWICQDMKRKVPETSYMAFECKMPTFYYFSDLREAGLDYDFLERVGQGSPTRLTDSQVEILHLAEEALFNSNRLLVWPDGDAAWEGYTDDSDMYLTHFFSKDLIELAARSHPKHILMDIACDEEDADECSH